MAGSKESKSLQEPSQLLPETQLTTALQGRAHLPPTSRAPAFQGWMGCPRRVAVGLPPSLLCSQGSRAVARGGEEEDAPPTGGAPGGGLCPPGPPKRRRGGGQASEPRGRGRSAPSRPWGPPCAAGPAPSLRRQPGTHRWGAGAGRGRPGPRPCWLRGVTWPPPGPWCTVRSRPPAARSASGSSRAAPEFRFRKSYDD